jgi:parvulin-like peptidyl-prolyl isomerase
MIARQAAARFAALGALLFALAHWFAADVGSPPAAGSSGTPTDEQVLLQAALARGLDRDDPVVQARLLHNMRFVTEANADSSALYREALRLGMADSDLIVRRRLIERMRLLLQAPAFDVEPSEADLRAYLDRNAARFAEPARVRFSHIFLSPARRGGALASDAHALLHELGRDEPDRAADLGDALPAPGYFSAASQQDLERLFGPTFAAAVFGLEPRRWHGPLASPYGAHLVWVYERLAAAPARLDVVRAAVRAALLEERADVALHAGLRGLRALPGSGGTGQ